MAHAEIAGIPRIGELVAGKYQIERILGQGGMGVVAAAWHVTLSKRVAVKFLRPGVPRLSEAMERFLREARAASIIDSEHVARVLDVELLDDGTPCMVMEFLSGIDLRAHLTAHGPLAIPEAVDGILQACEAIAEAHARGIVHRDLKPSNLFLADRAHGAPIVKVLDFGLAKATPPDDESNAQSLTATGAVMGSIYYMAPEQLRGLKNADARSDIWALGAVLYELLTAKRPFQGSSITDTIVRIAERPPRAISLWRTDVPPPLEAALMRCLEKENELRPQTVAELARALVPFGTSAAQASLLRIERCQVAMVGGVAHPADAADRGSTVVADAQQGGAPDTEQVNAATAPRSPLALRGSPRTSASPPAPASSPPRSSENEGAADSMPSPSEPWPTWSQPAPAASQSPKQALAATVPLPDGTPETSRPALPFSSETLVQDSPAAAPAPSGSASAPPAALVATVEAVAAGGRLRQTVPLWVAVLLTAAAAALVGWLGWRTMGFKIGRMMFDEGRLSSDGAVSLDLCHSLDRYGVDGAMRLETQQ